MNYDFIIPMGEECYTCGSIDSKFTSLSVRKHAFPFDYVGHVFIDTIFLKCKDLLLHKEKSVTSNSFTPTLFGDKYFFSDKEYNFHYWHDITHEDQSFTDTEIATFVEKYNRRYTRLLNALESKCSILFISVNHYDNIYTNIDKKEKLIELYKLLFEQNSNIHFLAINFCPESFIYKTLKHVVLETDKTLPFKESKEEFTENLYTFINKTLG